MKISREELYRRVWESPVVTLAKEFDISDVGLAKACRANAIPLPPRGYWMKLQHGKKVTKPELPPSAVGFVVIDAPRNRLPVPPNRKTSSADRAKIVLQPRSHELQLAPFAAATRKKLLSIKPADGLMEPREKDTFACRVSKGGIEEACRLLDALEKSAPQYGGVFAPGKEAAEFVHDGQAIALRLLEQYTTTQEPVPGKTYSAWERPPVVHHFTGMFTDNINNGNWRLKEAALMAFGMILDGPSGETLSPLVVQAMPILITCLRDPNVLVRDTSAWTIGRICELHKSCLSNEILPHMVAGIGASLEDPSPKVVSQACFAVHNLSEACSDESEASSNLLSHFMPQMLTKLLAITVREDWESENIRSTAYETTNIMVANSAIDMQPIVVQLLNEALGRLEQSFNPAINAQERMNLQSCLCSLIGEISKKLESEQVTPFADRIMTVLLKVFETKGAVAHEDAFMAIGFVAEKLGASFLRYLSFVQPPLIHGLKSVDEHQLVTVAVGVVGDLCRALGPQLLFAQDALDPVAPDRMRIDLARHGQAEPRGAVAGLEMQREHGQRHAPSMLEDAVEVGFLANPRGAREADADHRIKAGRSGTGRHCSAAGGGRGHALKRRDACGPWRGDAPGSCGRRPSPCGHGSRGRACA